MEHWWLVVKNNYGGIWCHLRHIVKIDQNESIDDAIKDYYRVFRKLAGDKFYIAKTREELTEIVERKEQHADGGED